jgi:hypothetical protein
MSAYMPKLLDRARCDEVRKSRRRALLMFLPSNRRALFLVSLARKHAGTLALERFWSSLRTVGYRHPSAAGAEAVGPAALKY